MIVDLNLNISELDQKLFLKPPTEAQLSDYANAYTEWDKLKVGEAPEMPRNGSLTPFEAGVSIIRKVLNDACQGGKTGVFRHIIRLDKELADQVVEGATSLNIPEDDLAFIRKSYATMDWQAKSLDIKKFITMVEEALKSAKQK